MHIMIMIFVTEAFKNTILVNRKSKNVFSIIFLFRTGKNIFFTQLSSCQAG